MKIIFILSTLLIFIHSSYSQNIPPKVFHAEPLYIDLIRDLGARKGEAEWNIGMGLTDKFRYDEYELLVEYEWAPIDRLGLEVEVPLTIHTNDRAGGPADRIESYKTALQWTFLVSEKHQTSMALGYLNELELRDLDTIKSPWDFTGNIFNPFFVAAKNWGKGIHTLIYTGPRIQKEFGEVGTNFLWEHNSNIHYVLKNSRNFVGIEFNKTIDQGNFDMVIRPQMRLEISEHLMIGIVTGIPINRQNERLGTFFRLIYEPGSEPGRISSLRNMFRRNPSDMGKVVR